MQIPVIINDVKQHIMDCAAAMRAHENKGMYGGSGYKDLASGLKNKMVGMHMQVFLTNIKTNGILRPCGDGARHAMPPEPSARHAMPPEPSH